MKLQTAKNRIRSGTYQLWLDLKAAASFIIKIALGVALGIALFVIAAPLLGG